MLRGKIPHFRLTCVAQKRRCLSSLFTFSVWRHIGKFQVLGYFYQIALGSAMKGYLVWYEQQGLRAAQVVHTHQTSCRLSWPRGFGALNSSPHSWIFTSVSVGSSPRSYLFTSATGRIGVHTAPKYGKKPIRDRRGAASPRHRSLTATTVFMCEQNPYPVWFSWRRKS